MKKTVRLLISALLLLSITCTGSASSETDVKNPNDVIETTVGGDGSIKYTFANGDTLLLDSWTALKADRLVDFELAIPNGGKNALVKVWDREEGIDTISDNEDKTVGVYSYANFISISVNYSLTDSNDLFVLFEDCLQDEIMDMVPFSYSEIKSIRTDGDCIWAVLQYGEGPDISERIIFVRNVQDNCALYGSISYDLSHSSGIAIALPSTDNINLVREAYGVTDHDGEELKINGIDPDPAVNLREVNVTDRKGKLLTTVFTWQEEPLFNNSNEMAEAEASSDAEQMDDEAYEPEFHPSVGEYVNGLGDVVRGLSVVTDIYAGTVDAYKIVEEYLSYCDRDIVEPYSRGEIIDSGNASYVVINKDDIDPEFAVTEYFVVAAEEDCFKIVDIDVSSFSQKHYLDEILDAYGIRDPGTKDLLKPADSDAESSVA